MRPMVPQVAMRLPRRSSSTAWAVNRGRELADCRLVSRLRPRDTELCALVAVAQLLQKTPERVGGHLLGHKVLEALVFGLAVNVVIRGKRGLRRLRALLLPVVEAERFQSQRLEELAELGHVRLAAGIEERGA